MIGGTGSERPGDAPWNDGIRYFDNAPFHGAGLAEIRVGQALAALNDVD